MTKSTITRERLEALANAEYCKSNPGAWLLGLKEVNELARMALAAMDSEPVAVIDLANLDYLLSGADADVWPPEREEMGDVLLYRHAQPVPVVMDDTKLRELFDSWFASDCSFDLSPEASEADNIAWRESYWYVWQRCRAAMLQAKSLASINPAPAMGSLPETGEVLHTNSPVITDEGGLPL